MTDQQKILRCQRSMFSSIEEINEAALSHIDTGESLTFADGSEAPLAIATGVGAEWNDSGLLIYFRGRFEKLRTDPAQHLHAYGKTPRLWEKADVYEIFIGPEARSSFRYREFQVSPDGRFFDNDVHRKLGVSNHNWYSGMECRSFVDHEMGIWTSVAALPWNALGGSAGAGAVFDVNFYRASGTYHGDQLMAWSPTGYGEKCFHRPQLFGVLECV